MKKFALLFLAVMLYACNSNQSTGTNAASAEAKTPAAVNPNQYEMEDAGNGLKLATKRNADGKIIEQGFMKNGKKEGAWKVYEKSFDFPKYIISYVDGAYNGPYFEYTDHGQVEIQSNYKNNKLHGHWGQYKFGKIIKTANYTDGLLDGLYAEYNQRDGTPKMEATYKMGKQDGSMKYYNDKGEVILEYTFRNGEKIGDAKVIKHDE